VQLFSTKVPLKVTKRIARSVKTNTVLIQRKTSILFSHSVYYSVILGGSENVTTYQKKELQVREFSGSKGKPKVLMRTMSQVLQAQQQNKKLIGLSPFAKKFFHSIPASGMKASLQLP